MKIFVDFENAILNNSLTLECFFLSLRKYGLNCFKNLNKVVLSSLPYNPKIFSMLKENYSEHSNIIHVLFSSKNKVYAEMFQMQMKNEFPKIELIPIQENDKLKTIKKSATEFAYIGGTIWDWKIFREATESCFAGSFLSVIIYWLIVKKSKDSRINFVEGFLSLFFKHINIILPIFAIWPSWMEVNETILNLTQIKAVFISSMGFMSFMSILKALTSLDKERSFFQQEITPLCAREFIDESAKIRSAIIISIIFFLFGVYGIFVHVFGGLIGLFFSLVFFVVHLGTFWFKWSRLLLVFFLVGIGSNLVFAKKLFKII
jgi:hypothetical protein